MNSFKTLLVFCAILSRMADALNHEANLHKYLFMPEENSTLKYDPNVRPVKDSFKRVDVEVRLGIKRLFEMDEINHRVTIFAILIKVWPKHTLSVEVEQFIFRISSTCFKKWKDDFLTWDPKDFGNITFTYVKYNQIWSPRLALVSK